MDKNSYNINDLKNIMNRLLGEDGCPWDKAQDHSSLRKYLIEECYEAIEAINNQDMENLKEELGDILFQIVFHSKLAEDKGSFNFDDVVNEVSKKMIYRHPHVFSNESKDIKARSENWDKLKEKEKGYRSPKEILESVPKALPSLIRAEKIIGKAYKYNMDSFDLASLSEEIHQLADMVDRVNIDHKIENMELIGKLLINLTKFSFFLQLNADFSLTNALETYITKVEEKWYA